MPNGNELNEVYEVLEKLAVWCNTQIKVGTRQRGLTLVAELRRVLASTDSLQDEEREQYIGELEEVITNLEIVVSTLSQQHVDDIGAMEASNAEWTADFEAQKAQFEGIVERLVELIEERDGRIKELEVLLEPPHDFGAFVRITPEEEVSAERGELPSEVQDSTSEDDDDESEEEDRIRVDVVWRNRVVSMFVSSEIDPEQLKFGQRLVISANGSVLRALDEFEERGIEAIVDEVLADGRIRLEVAGGDKIIAYVAESDELSTRDLKPGDTVLYHAGFGFVFELLPEKESSSLFLQEIPDILFSDIGGQDVALGLLREHVERPLLYRELCLAYGYKLSAGILLHGPPGVGKTLSLKALANEIRLREQREVMMLEIAGPELMNKWVGETERMIREPFKLAETLATRDPDALIIVLFDEIDAMFPTRGSRSGDAGVSMTAVTQFCTMLDGISEHGNIIIIGTTNRPDTIDPALTRPGRLFPPIEYPRPGRDGIKRVFEIYIGQAEVPLHAKYTNPNSEDFRSENRDDVVEYLIERCLERIYLPEGIDRDSIDEGLRDNLGVLTARFQDNGEEKQFFMEDLITPALAEAIVTRSTQFAMSDDITAHEAACEEATHIECTIVVQGIRFKHLVEAIEETFVDGKALPSRTDPREWARILNLDEGRPFEIISSDKAVRTISSTRTTGAT